MSEPNLFRAIRIVSAILCLLLGLRVAISLPNSSVSILRLFLIVIPLLIAAGLIRKLNWSRIPAELCLTFICFLISAYFFPSPDARNTDFLQYIFVHLSPLITALIHLLLWSPFLAMAYIISNGERFYKKQWW
jgi:uncharacterized membrane protein